MYKSYREAYKNTFSSQQKQTIRRIIMHGRRVLLLNIKNS